MSYHPILKIICRHYSLTPEEIKRKTRLKRIVYARQMFYLMVYENTRNISLTRMASVFNQDHATALHSIRKISDEINLYPEVRAEYELLLSQLKGRFIPRNKYYKNNQYLCNPCIYEKLHKSRA